MMCVSVKTLVRGCLVMYVDAMRDMISWQPSGDCETTSDVYVQVTILAMNMAMSMTATMVNHIYIDSVFWAGTADDLTVNQAYRVMIMDVVTVYGTGKVQLLFMEVDVFGEQPLRQHCAEKPAAAAVAAAPKKMNAGRMAEALELAESPLADKSQDHIDRFMDITIIANASMAEGPRAVEIAWTSMRPEAPAWPLRSVRDVKNLAK